MIEDTARPARAVQRTAGAGVHQPGPGARLPGADMQGAAGVQGAAPTPGPEPAARPTGARPAHTESTIPPTGMEGGVLPEGEGAGGWCSSGLWPS